MEEAILKFTNYVNSNYDVSNQLIKLKYVHTLSVTSIILQMAGYMNLSDSETMLAFYIALFHDLGRFREVERQQVFNNLKFDHGAYSNKILFNDGLIKEFNINEEDYLTIRKALYFHNKKEVKGPLSEREQFFCDLIRDADRIDIFRVITEEYPNSLVFDKPTDTVLFKYLQGEPMHLKELKTKADRVLLRLNFVKLFKFNESFRVLRESGYLDKFLNSIKVTEKTSELFDEIKKDIDEYIKGDEKNVRQKVQSFRSREE